MRRLLSLCLALGPACLAAAQPLPDPTQPRFAGARGATTADAAPAPAPVRPVLQGLRLGARPSAVINGQLLRPGQKLDGYTLLRLDAEAVVVVDAEGKQHRIPLLDPVASTPRKEVRP